MKKITGKINFEYIFDPNRKGAKFSIGSAHWFNSGEFAEIADKAIRGYSLTKDANTAYDRGSDIEETSTSVKSGKATLTSKVLGSNKAEVLKVYFETVHSTNWDWVIMIDDSIIVYNMNAEEFREFCEEWSSYDESRKVVRFKSSSGKMIKWLEERAQALPSESVGKSPTLKSKSETQKEKRKKEEKIMMTYQEMLYELEKCGFTRGTLHCFSLAHENGASDAELYELFEDLMCD